MIKTTWILLVSWSNLHGRKDMGLDIRSPEFLLANYVILPSLDLFFPTCNVGDLQGHLSVLASLVLGPSMQISP